jgi:hypothetical protein
MVPLGHPARLAAQPQPCGRWTAAKSTQLGLGSRLQPLAPRSTAPAVSNKNTLDRISDRFSKNIEKVSFAIELLNRRDHDRKKKAMGPSLSSTPD